MPTFRQPQDANQPRYAHLESATVTAPEVAPRTRPAPAAPRAPGGGTLQQPFFSGDHVLESIAKGVGTLKEGARGPAVRAIQQFLAGQGHEVGRNGPDGSFGAATKRALQAWQMAHGLPMDGVLGKDTLTAMEAQPAVASAEPGATVHAPAVGRVSRPAPPVGAPATPAQAKGGTKAHGGPVGSKNGGLPEDFQKMWDAHPHNYQDDSRKNTASADLQVAQGWSPDQYSNTCAIRMSILFNNLGGNFKITREKAKAAGIDPGRVPFSKKTGWYYILSAKEMWTYLERHAGRAHVTLPARGRFSKAEDFQKAYDKDIAPAVAGRKGIVAFDKIFGFSGSGHVDLFDGEHLSDSASWYPSQALRLWYV